MNFRGCIFYGTAKIITKEEAATNFLQQFPLKLRYKTLDDKPTLIYIAKRIGNHFLISIMMVDVTTLMLGLEKL